MTLAAQLVGKTTKTALNGLLQEKQIVGAVELTQYTNVS